MEMIDKDRHVSLMGILNLTPDSFYEPSRYNMSILDSGADIIDIGACSTRPGHVPVGAEEEWRRLAPVITHISRHRPDLRISIDSYWSEVVRRVYDRIGPFLVNDVSAGKFDSQLLPTVAELHLPYVAMHDGPAEGVEDVAAFFHDFEEKADRLGIREWILDPGFGFGKSNAQNLRLIGELGELRRFGRKILVGISRKRMTYEPSGLTPQTALSETQRLHMVALNGGADILRVHDVAEARETLARWRGMRRQATVSVPAGDTDVVEERGE